MRIRRKTIYKAGTVIYTIGFVLSITSMYLAEFLPDSMINTRMIEYCLGFFLIGAIMVMCCLLQELMK